MDAFAQLALMTKMQRVFEVEDTFLSFPVLSPLVYPPERLGFADPANATAQSLADMSEFSRITNRMPRGVIAPIDEDEHLWDVYGEVLQTAEVAARAAPSADQQKRYDRALELLYVIDADGVRTDSAALTAYKQHRDAHIKAVEEYNNRRSTGELSDDPAVKAQWAEDEPVLRENIDRIMSEWRKTGRKDAVEAAQQDEEAFVVRTPSLQWDEWKTSFVRDIDVATDTNLIEFAPTAFSPYDVFDQGYWQCFNLSKDEVSKLATEAPAELTAIFGSEAGASRVESLSFEYRSVALTRPWFRSAIFRSRFWRLTEEGGELSDGGDPPKGRCPSYVAGLVFARNITIAVRTEGPAKEVTPKAGLLQLDASLLEHAHEIVRAEAREAPPARPFIMSDLLAFKPDLSALRTVAPDTAEARTPVRAVTAAPIAVRRVAPTVVEPPAARIQTLAFTERGRLTVEPVRLTIPIPEPAPPEPAPPEPTPEPAPPEPPEEHVVTTTIPDVAIVAFICKPLPRCSDPDPKLDWS